jgi:carbamoyltransferase
MNQALWQSGRLSEQWIYPNPGDAGLAAGAGLLAHATLCPEIPCEPLRHFSLGPEYSSEDIRSMLKQRGLSFREVPNPAEATVPYLLENHVIGWFQGRMEAGPRALGNRSILMDPRRRENKDIINKKIKFRETFRPFCPSMLSSRVEDYLVNSRDERFMISSFPVRDAMRALMPAVVHVDGTVRPQVVHRETHPLYYELIERFGHASGIEALLNTSFNINGEPIVCTPRDALRTFFDSGLDVLVMDKFIVEKPALQHTVARPPGLTTTSF